MISTLVGLVGMFCIGWGFGYQRGRVEGRLQGRAEILRERNRR